MPHTDNNADNTTQTMNQNDVWAEARAEKVKNNKIAMLRVPAFFIDSLLIGGIFFVIQKICLFFNLFTGEITVNLIMFCIIPLSFFVYWVSGINLGKRLFRLKVVDERTLKPPTVYQYFKRCLLFSLMVSFNMAFLIPLFASKKNKSFHDMVAGTIVIRESKT